MLLVVAEGRPESGRGVIEAFRRPVEQWRLLLDLTEEVRPTDRRIQLELDQIAVQFVGYRLKVRISRLANFAHRKDLAQLLDGD